MCVCVGGCAYLCMQVCVCFWCMWCMCVECVCVKKTNLFWCVCMLVYECGMCVCVCVSVRVFARVCGCE